MADYTNYIKGLLIKRKAIVGKELNQLISKKFNISIEYARKVVSREIAKGTMLSTKPITFGNRQYGYYLGDLTDDKVIELSKSRPPMYRVIKGLKNNQGVLSYYECMKLSGAPVDEKNTKKSTLNEIISTLQYLGIVKEERKYKGVLFVISYDNDKYVDGLEYHYKKMKLDVVFMKDILHWLRKSNLIENEKKYRSVESLGLGAIANNYVWDAIGFNRATGFNTVNESNSKSKDKKALVVIDVKISSVYSSIDLDGFYSRVQNTICRSKGNTQKVIPIIVAENFTDEAKGKCMELGFIHFSLGAVFGERIFEIINSYYDIFDFIQRNSISEVNKVIENIEVILEKIKDTGQDGNLRNLRGDLFEYIIYAALQELIPQYSIKHSVNIPGKFEYDFVAKNYQTNECIVIEAKGYKSDSVIKLGNMKEKNTVKWFWRNTFPCAKNNLKNIDGFNIRACYITSAQFSSEANEFLGKLSSSKLKPLDLNHYYDGEMLLDLLKSENHRLKKCKEMIKKYYVVESVR